MAYSEGNDRIVGALVNLGYHLTDQTVGNIRRRHGIPPAQAELDDHLEGVHLPAHGRARRADFFTVEVLTWKGLMTFYVLFSFTWTAASHHRRITAHPDQSWMQQVARNATLEHWGYLNPCRYVSHDRDPKFCASFRDT